MVNTIYHLRVFRHLRVYHLRYHISSPSLSRTFSSNPVGNAEFCEHSDPDRGFITEVTHVELDLALSHGYQVTHLYR